VFPGAYINVQSGNWPVKRHYEIIHTPTEASFSATLTLSFSDHEYVSGRDPSKEQLFLSRWDGESWVDCPPEHSRVGIEDNTVTCTSVTAFSPWVFAGPESKPDKGLIQSLLPNYDIQLKIGSLPLTFSLLGILLLTVALVLFFRRAR
jgi:hypothetical protein